MSGPFADNFYGLLLEPIAKFVVDFGDDFGAGGGEVGIGGGGFVNEDEGGFGVDAEAMEEGAFESDLLDKPSGIDFVTVGTMMDGVAFVFGEFGLGIA